MFLKYILYYLSKSKFCIKYYFCTIANKIKKFLTKKSQPGFVLRTRFRYKNCYVKNLDQTKKLRTCSVVLTFESVDEILWCDHSNKTSSSVLLHGTICFFNI